MSGRGVLLEIPFLLTLGRVWYALAAPVLRTTAHALAVACLPCHSSMRFHGRVCYAWAVFPFSEPLCMH